MTESLDRGLPDKECLRSKAPVTPVRLAKRIGLQQRPPARLPDYVSIREVDAKGKLLTEHRFMACTPHGCNSEWCVDPYPQCARKDDSGTRGLRLHAHSHLGKELEQCCSAAAAMILFQHSPKTATELNRAGASCKIQ